MHDEQNLGWLNDTLGLSTRALKVETRFTGFGSPIRIRSGLAWAPHGMQTMRIALHLTHCHTAQHAAWIQIEAMWRQSGLWIWIPDLHRIWIQGLV